MGKEVIRVPQLDLAGRCVDCRQKPGKRGACACVRRSKKGKVKRGKG